MASTFNVQLDLISLIQDGDMPVLYGWRSASTVLALMAVIGSELQNTQTVFSFWLETTRTGKGRL